MRFDVTGRTVVLQPAKLSHGDPPALFWRQARIQMSNLSGPSCLALLLSGLKIGSDNPN
jgi:hypothetical protein